ncbi:MAG: lipoprotein signal peptidase [Flammeovirgaceae bacterium]
MKYARYYLICLLVVVLDHTAKLLIHFNLELGEEIIVFDDWFRLHYLLNPGMAFGMQFDFAYGKLFLSLFRILATIGIGYYLYAQAKKKVHRGFLICLALILGGAIGNAIDSIFYGVLLENNAIIGAETPWFHGRVIDMLYFPLFNGVFPEWLPIWGGKHFYFFSAIFNIADSAIFIGAVSILIFQRRFFPKIEPKDQNMKNEPSSANL